MMQFLDHIGDGAAWRVVERGINETITQAVIAGVGIALISQHPVTEELRSGRPVPCAASACRFSEAGICCAVPTVNQASPRSGSRMNL